MPKNVFAVYMIRNSINGKIYIGKTSNPYTRLGQYKSDFRTLNKRRVNDYLANAVKKYGTESFIMVILEKYKTEQECSEGEIKWMDAFNSTNSNFGYNLRRDSSTGMIVSDSTRKKISNRIKKEWADGIRAGHSKKLKKSWEDRDREAQGLLFSKILTKYKYIIKTLDQIIEADYKTLKAMGLSNVLSSFHRLKTDKCTFKGYEIERIKHGL